MAIPPRIPSLPPNSHHWHQLLLLPLRPIWDLKGKCYAPMPYLQGSCSVFKERGFQKAWEKKSETYLNSLANSIWTLNNNDYSEHRHIAKSFKRSLRFTLIQFLFQKSKETLSLSIENAPNVYDATFPLFMKLCSYFLAAWHKIRP